MKKKILVGILMVLGLVIMAGVLLWYMMGKPLYEPGMVRAGKNLRASLTPPKQAGDANFWNVEKDISLFHFSDGTGKSVLVVHGGPGYPIHNPPPGLRLLSAKYKFIYYDQRGCGRSTRPIDRFASSNYFENVRTLDRTLGIGAQIADIERIRRILGGEKLVILGHSFGAFLASLYAAEFPEKIKGLIFVAPANLLLMPPEDGGLFEEVRQLLPAHLQAEYGDFLRDYLDYGHIFSKSETDLVSLNGRFARYYGVAARMRNMPIPMQSEAGEGGGWMVHAMYLGMGKRYHYRVAVKHVKAPVLVLHGDNDLQPEKTSRMLADCFPNCRFRIIEKAGHFISDDQPEELAAVVGRFLDEMQ